MKKYILLLFMVFMPFIVNAESCDAGNISVKSISVKDKSDNVVELEEATADGNSINLNLSMSEVGDSIEYKVTAKNNSNDDYELGDKSFNLNSDYINYSISSDDNSNVVKAKSSKIINLKVEYENEVPEEAYEEGTFNDNKTMTLSLVNSVSTINPKTGVQSYILISIIILVISTVLYVVLKKKKCAKYVALLLGATAIIPISVYALCKYEIKVDSKVKIIDNSTLIYWALQDNDNDTINETLVFSGHPLEGNYKGSFKDNKNFGNSSTPWTNVSKYEDYYTDNNLSYKVSHVYFEEKIYPKNTVRWFYGVGSKANTLVIDVNNLDVSNVTDMNHMFIAAGEGSSNFSIIGMNNWDTSKVTNMAGMFQLAGNTATTWSIGDLSEWNVSNVTDMNYMFTQAGTAATTWSIGDLSEWDVSSVKDMGGMFYTTAYYTTSTWDIGNLDNWNVSNVTNMQGLFSLAGRNATTWNVGNLSEWDTSNVTNMKWLFNGSGYNASNFSLDISNWDTSNVTEMHQMFNETGKNATTWSVKIPKTNGNGISNTTSKIYGSTTSVYEEVSSSKPGRTFTVAD